MDGASVGFKEQKRGIAVRFCTDSHQRRQMRRNNVALCCGARARWQGTTNRRHGVVEHGHGKSAAAAASHFQSRHTLTPVDNRVHAFSCKKTSSWFPAAAPAASASGVKLAQSTTSLPPVQQFEHVLHFLGGEVGHMITILHSGAAGRAWHWSRAL